MRMRAGKSLVRTYVRVCGVCGSFVRTAIYVKYTWHGSADATCEVGDPLLDQYTFA